MDFYWHITFCAIKRKSMRFGQTIFRKIRSFSENSFYIVIWGSINELFSVILNDQILQQTYSTLFGCRRSDWNNDIIFGGQIAVLDCRQDWFVLPAALVAQRVIHPELVRSGRVLCHLVMVIGVRDAVFPALFLTSIYLCKVSIGVLYIIFFHLNQL